jgi:hypothetical protein
LNHKKFKIIETCKTKEKKDFQGIFILQVLCQCYSFDIELPFFASFKKLIFGEAFQKKMKNYSNYTSLEKKNSQFERR